MLADAAGQCLRGWDVEPSPDLEAQGLVGDCVLQAHDGDLEDVCGGRAPLCQPDLAIRSNHHRQLVLYAGERQPIFALSVGVHWTRGQLHDQLCELILGQPLDALRDRTVGNWLPRALQAHRARRIAPEPLEQAEVVAGAYPQLSRQQLTGRSLRQ